MPRIISLTQFDPTSTMASHDSASSSPPERHRLRRKPSQHFTVNPFASSHRPYSPSTRASDIARLLDPSYASPPPQSAFNNPRGSTSAIREVYVDHHGDLHDPDFRDFPTFTNKNQSRWHRSDDESDESDDDVDDDKEVHTPSPRSIDLPRRRPSHMTHYCAPAYYSYDEPASYQSSYLAELGDEGDKKLVQHERASPKDKCPKSSQSEKSFPHDSPVEDPEPSTADSDWTPTCGHAIRRQWHALTLSLRFSLFRTKRRIKRKMSI